MFLSPPLCRRVWYHAVGEWWFSPHPDRPTPPTGWVPGGGYPAAPHPPSGGTRPTAGRGEGIWERWWRGWGLRSRVVGAGQTSPRRAAARHPSPRRRGAGFGRRGWRGWERRDGVVVRA